MYSLFHSLRSPSVRASRNLRTFAKPFFQPKAAPLRDYSSTSQRIMADNSKFTIANIFNVENYVCVVTGGGTGIGLMIAQAFANNGAKVYICGRRTDVLEQSVKTWGQSLKHPKGQLIPMQLDVGDKDSIQQLVKEISKNEKHIDLLVNNAGISKGSTEVERGDESAKELSEELFNEDMKNWMDVYNTNVIGCFFTTCAFIPLLSAAVRKNNGVPEYTPSVINIASMSGITRTTQHHFKYNVSKAAAIHLSTLLAQELRRKAVNIRVNNISPGIFPSEMTVKESDELNKSYIDHQGGKWGEEKGVPAGRPGRDEDMAQAAIMLACNQYAYGQTFAIDGGYLLEHP